ncbi:MAG: methyltransferase [Bermanella sp.]|jgi:16S RNA G1207 methylase RsmC
MLQDTLQCSAGHFTLLRPGASHKQPLRAWDASDEYLIELVAKQHASSRVTLLNDQFGALAVALNEQVDCWVSDSYCASAALSLNLKENNKSALQQATPLASWSAEPSLGVMKLPKNLSYLHFLLQRCQQAQISTLLIAGMMKHLPKNILNFLQQFGSVQRHPFKKKATVYELQLQQVKPSPYPKLNRFADIELITHANVFGRDKLDPGADFFLQHVDALPQANSVADLCCGSGILGLKYAQINANCHLSFFDESIMAVESAQLSWQENRLNNPSSFHWNDGLGHQQDNHYDLILCNPPFHEQFTVGDHIAKRLFKDAKQSLKPGGQLVVVGNRHLSYHVTLKQYFQRVEQIASNGKFVLLCAHA